MTVTVKKEVIEVWASEDGYRGDLDCISWNRNLYTNEAKSDNDGLGDESYLVRKSDNKKVAIVSYWFGNNGQGKIAKMKIQSLEGFEVIWKE